VKCLEQAQFLLPSLTEDMEHRRNAEKEIHRVVKALSPLLKCFLELSVTTQATGKLDTLLAILDQWADILDTKGAIKYTKLTATIEELRSAFVLFPHGGALAGKRKWKLLRKLFEHKLLVARITLLSTKHRMISLRQRHALMKCQALVLEVRDQDFKDQFLKESTKVLSRALKEAVVMKDTWHIMYVVKVAHTWGLCLDDGGAVGQLITKTLVEKLRFPLFGWDDIKEVLLFMRQVRTHKLKKMPPIEPLISRVAYRFVENQEALLSQLYEKSEKNITLSVSQAIDLRRYIDPPAVWDAPLFLAMKIQFDKEADIVEWMISYCESCKIHLPEWLLTKDQITVLHELTEALRTRDHNLIREAIVNAKQTKGGIENGPESLRSEYRHALDKLREWNQIPAGWHVEQLFIEAEKPMYLKKEIDNGQLRAKVQELFDSTYNSKGTRDRKEEMAKRYIIKRVQMVENVGTWKEYVNRAKEVKDEVKNYPDSVPVPEMKWKEWSGRIIGVDMHKEILAMCGLPELDESINEYIFFHGTNPFSAESIALNHFDMSFASKTGLFGAGIYFAESCSKSDEYCLVADEHEEYPMFLVRVQLGRINYRPEVDAWKNPGQRAMENSCLSGEYHTVLGDRLKSSGTYREFVVYDNFLAYPHFLVWYSKSR